MYPQSSQSSGQGQPRHSSYGGAEVAKSAEAASRGVSTNSGRNNGKQRERNRTRIASTSKGKEAERTGEVLNEKEKDGTRGFMGGMRRISLVGKHKRSKSAASLALVGESDATGSVGASGSDEPSLPDLPKEALMMMNLRGKLATAPMAIPTRRLPDQTFFFHRSSFNRLLHRDTAILT